MKFSTIGGTIILALGIAACGGSGGTGTATYVPASGTTFNTALWVANGTNVVEFTPAQMMPGTTDPAPQVSLNSPAFGAPQGVQFDANGDLWVIDGGTLTAGGNVAPALDEFTPAQLASLHARANPMPYRQITSANFKFPQQAVFDRSGNLWVTDNGANTVDVFTPLQLAAGGRIIANTTISASPAFTGPLGIAFDRNNDLFVANNGTTTIFEFNASLLSGLGPSATIPPNVVLSDNGKGSIQGPWGLAFDKYGDLWSSNANAPNTVVEFAKGSLSATGSPNPAVTLNPTGSSGTLTLAAPNGIAFDNVGDLAAISSAAPFGVADFGSLQLSAGGPAQPTLLVGTVTTLNAPAGAVFGPNTK